MFKHLSIFLFATTILSCNQQNKDDNKAKEIIKKSVEAHGGDAYNDVDISFDFRKYRFHIKQNGVNFLYERSTKDSLNNETKDILTNDSFRREINGVKQDLSAKDEGRFREATNSVAYFVLLPYKLLDKAVNAEHVGTMTINGQNYDKIKVWFDKEGGGKDHDDVFCYWINQQTHTLDYLAYDNGGPRFRKATKREKVNGVVFQDYENYEIADTLASTSDYDKFFVEGKVKLLSKIEQTNYVSKVQ
jgi:hypothetical protein